MEESITPEISIIIVSWNTKKFLLECLDSIRNSQPNLSIEIIVVDNASSDGSADAVEKYHPYVHLIRNDVNSGFAEGNNIGISQSKGHYICLINSDVRVFPHCLSHLKTYIDNHPSIGMIGPRILNTDHTLQCTCRRLPSLWNTFCSASALYRLFPNSTFFGSDQMFYFKHDVIQQVEVLAGCFLMVRRDALMQVGYLDSQFFMYAEDIDWCKRFRDARWDIVFFPAAESIHHGGASSANAPLVFSAAQEKSLLQYWLKHHGRLSSVMFFFIILLQHSLRIGLMSFACLIRSSYKRHYSQQIRKHLSCLHSLFRTSAKYLFLKAP